MGKHGNEYFLLKDLARNPSLSAVWKTMVKNRNIEKDHSYNNLPGIVEAMSYAKEGSQMNKEIVKDILSCVPSKYFQKTGKDLSADEKLKLSYRLSQAQLHNIFEFYTSVVPLEGRTKKIQR